MKNSKHKLRSFFNNVWPILVLLLLVSMFFWKVFIKGYVPIPADFIVGVYFPWLDYKWDGFPAGVPVKNPIMADIPSFIYPMQTYAISIFKSGLLPLWNPLILTGTPLLANFQSAPLSIVNIFYFLTDTYNAWTTQIIFQHILAALSVYFLLRFWGVSKFGSLLAGFIFSFSGYNLIWSQWNGHTLAAAFVPILILFTDRYLVNGKIIDGFLISISTFLMFVSGYPQTFLYLFFCLFILWLIRFSRSKIFFARSLLVALFFLLGIGLSAPQIIPGYELLKNSQRVVEYHPYEWAFLPYKKVITFIAPDFYGNHATKNYWGPQDYTSNTGFVGVVAFVLALTALVGIKKSKTILFSAILVIVSLLLAFPTPISIFLWKSGIFGLNAASAHRSLVVFNLGMALLSGFGFDQKKLGRWALLLPFLMLVGFAVYAFSLDKMVGLRNLILPSIVLFVFCFLTIAPKLKYFLIVMAALEIFYFGWKFTPFSPKHIIFPTTPVLDYLMSQPKPFRVTGNKVIPMNMRMMYGLESPEGYDALYSVGIAKFLSTLNDQPSDTSFAGRYGFVDRENSRLLDLVNTKYFMAIKKDKTGKPSFNGEVLDIYKSDKFSKVFEDGSVTILENKNALPRAFMVYNYEVMNDNLKILDKLLDKKFPLDRVVILKKDPQIAKHNKLVKNKVEYLDYQSQMSSISVETEEAGMLFVSDSDYVSWKAYVDGVETEIYNSDFNFRSVVVPAGKHIIQFKYQPDSFIVGVKVFVYSLIFLVLLSVLLWVYTKKNEK